MSEELFADAWDRLYDEALERGLSEEEAGQYADTNADAAYRERIADAIDYARLLKKEGIV